MGGNGVLVRVAAAARGRRDRLTAGPGHGPGRRAVTVPPMSMPSELLEILGRLVRAAIGAFARTLVAMLALAIVLAIAAGVYAGGGAAWAGALAALAAFALTAVLAVTLAGKRALWGGAREGIERSQVASRVVGALFDRIAAVPGAAAVERVPLADAERRLRAAVTGWLGESPRGLRGVVARGLATRVERLTLAHLRDGDHGDGVDLGRVRREIAARADALLLDKLGRSTRIATWLMVGGAVVGAAAVAIVLRQVA